MNYWRLLTFVALLGCGQAFAQSLQQAGPAAPGHIPMYIDNRTVIDGGAAGGGGAGANPSELGLTVRSPTGTYPATNAGTGPLGSNLCSYDAPLTNPTGYHWLCLSPNAQGGGLIAYGSSGTATPLPLKISVNGLLLDLFTPATPFTVSGNGATNADSLNGRFGQTLNVKSDFGAAFDAKTITAVSTIASGDNSLTVIGAGFVSTDVGKNIVVDGAGPLSTLGVLSSIPVTAAGSGYTAAPTINLSNLGSAAGAKALANMKIISATVTTGGSGCTDGVVTFPPVGTVAGTAASITGTVSGGALTGALTITLGGAYSPGSVNDSYFSATVLGAFVPGCAVRPTITVSWGVGSIAIVGRGENVPLVGVTAAVSAGSATLGTPVVTQLLTPLSTTIAAVTDSQNVKLAANASNSLAAATTTLLWGHDDGPAFARAKVAADNIFAATGTSPTIQMPLGSSFVSSTIPTFFKTPLRIQGMGPGQTNIYMDPAMTSPLFSMSENFIGTNFVAHPTIWAFNNGYAPSISNFAVYGDTTSPNDQIAFNFYDRTDHVYFNNVVGATIHGSLFKIGDVLNTTTGYMRESYFNDAWCGNCGSQNNPVFDIGNTAIVGTDTTNNNEFNDLMAFSTDGTCIAIRSKAPSSAKALNGLNFHGGRCENDLTYNAAPNVKIGDTGAAYTGPIADIIFFGMRTKGLPLGGTGALITAPALGVGPLGVNFKGLVAQGSGVAVDIEAGSNIAIEPSSLVNQNYKFIVGPASSLLTGPIYIDYHGAEIGIDTIIDATSAPFVYWPMFRTGTPDLVTASVVANAHDGTAKGGNALPAQAVDLSVSRTDPAQVAGATSSTIGGGVRNQIGVSAQGATIPGGTDHTLGGRYSSATGRGCNDYARRGFDCYGGYAAFGDFGTSQSFRTNLGASIASVTPTVLTTDGAVASAINILNLVTKDSLTFSFSIQCRDNTNNTDYAIWDTVSGSLFRGTGNTSYRGGYSAPTGPSASAGSGSTASATVSADTTNQGISVLVTMPNTDAWRCDAFFNGGETR